MFFGTVERPPRLSEFELEIPEKLIAQNPPKNRDKCRLMIVDRTTGEIQHKKFYNIVDLFNKGDVLVLNNTQVFPARLFATKDKSDDELVSIVEETGARVYRGSTDDIILENSKIGIPVQFINFRD